MEIKGNVLMQKYDFGRLLGQGDFAKVYHARNLKSGDNVAVKVIDKEKVLKAGLIDQTKREISAMGLVKHRNIVELHEVMATKTKIYFVMEYCKGGELFKKVAKGRLKEDVARKFFQQLICAVDFCHNRGVYHRDLKPENLLLDENGTLKVTDFGLSAVAASRCQDGLLHTACGTPAYTAPEVISRRGYDGAKADIWSCGVILYFLLTGQLPFHDSNLMEMYRKISKAEIKFPDTFPPEARRLIIRMLDPNPITRVSISKIMGNPWFKKGLDSKHIRSSAVEKEGLSPINIDAVFGPAEVKRPDFAKLTSLNAFDIISLSTGFDLSGLFVENDQKDEAKFTSIESASVIMSKLEEVARHLKLEVSKKEGGFFKFERSNEGRKMPLSIDIEIFEISSSFHLVEVNKSCGDAVEYQTIFKQDIKPALKDIVWAWQGEYQFQQQPYLQ